jgi:hypothetical protein
MKHIWLNDGEPDENGEYIAIIENSAGARVSTFKGKTVKEVADKLLESQVNANREISRLRRPDQGRQGLKVQPRDLTPADKLRLSAEITDPDKVVDAVTEIVTAQQGTSPASVGRVLSKQEQEAEDAYHRAQAIAFARATPDYYPVPQNLQALMNELQANGYNFTTNNLEIVFQTLTDREELIPWPSEEEKQDYVTQMQSLYHPNGQQRAAQPPAQEPNPPSPTNAPNTRPRSIATGIRSSDASASAPPPPPKKRQFTRADIERMSRAEYTDLLRNPDFKRQVDALGA